MIKILFECVLLTAILICLLQIKCFSKAWLNICVYILLGLIAAAIISVGCAALLGFPKTIYIFIPFVLLSFISYIVYSNSSNKSSPLKNEDTFILKSEKGDIEFYYPRDNFLVYGGAGSGKTGSLGKPLLEEYIKHGYAGFIYDYKDVDYTKTAFTLCEKYNYPYKYYRVNFTDLSRTHRFNPLKRSVVGSEASLIEILNDFLKAMLPPDAKTDEWFNGALGLLQGVALRFFTFRDDYEKYCTLPHIVNFILLANAKELENFLEGYTGSIKAASAFLDAKGSEKTQSSYLSSLSNYLTRIGMNRNVCYVLSGDDFDFNLTDPKDPKLLAVSNNLEYSNTLSPIIAMLIPMTAKKIKFGNKVKFAYILDEMTTFKVNNFQEYPSVLREYGASFLIMTQSATKLTKVYGKEDKQSIESNCANIFLGRTKDTIAIKEYPDLFGKIEKEKKSTSAGSSSGNHYNSSVTTSTQKEYVYESNEFPKLTVGEFILSAGKSNVEYLKTRFKEFKLDEQPLPVICVVREKDVDEVYHQIEKDAEKILCDFCGR